MLDVVRFQSGVPNRRGTFPGVFALANGLAAEAILSSSDRAWWRQANDRMNAVYPQPSALQPGCYDSAVNSGARAWFRCSATHLLELTREYLDLLDRYDVPWVELRTSNPGRITYEDEVQVVAVPHAYPAGWAFATNDDWEASREIHR